MRKSNLDDQILCLARELFDSEGVCDHYEKQKLKTGPAGGGYWAFNAAYKHALDRSFSLEEMMTHIKASSLAGAACQLVLSHNLLCAIESADIASLGLDKDIRAMRRMLFSALRAIERECGTSIKDLLPGDRLNEYMDPWIGPEERRSAESVQLQEAGQ